MAESSDSGRLDRIEALLERRAETRERDQEEFTRDHKRRIADLVGAIGKLIETRQN